MKLRVFLLTIIFSLAELIQAQNDSYSLKYREDQFYISFSMIFQKESIDGFKQNGFSNNFQIGFLRDVPLNKKGGMAIALGMGYGFDKIFSNLNLDKDERGKLSFSILNNNQNIQKVSSLIFPFEFRLRTSTLNKTDFWRLYGGLKYKINLNAQFKSFTGGNFKDNFIRKRNKAVYLSLGYNTWNILVEFDLDSIYNQNISMKNHFNTEIRLIKIGLIFYIL